MGPETLMALRLDLFDWGGYEADEVEREHIDGWSTSLDAHAAAWEADRKRIRLLEGYIAMLGAGTECHHPDCPQFTGPYDLGELEPACTCGYDALMAGA